MAGVAREHQGSALGAHLVAQGGHGVIGGQGPHRARAQRNGLVDSERLEDHPGLVRPRDRGEVGPDHPVEDVGAQRGDGLGQRVHHQRRAAQAADRIDEQR